MEGNNESGNDARGKRIGTREEVFKGLAARTAGGLTKADIIAKQFGTRILYISKRLSDRMRENFQNTNNNFRKRVRKTLVATNNTPAPQQLMQDTMTKPVSMGSGVKAHHAKTLKFKVSDNTVRNVYYKELQGQNLQKLKEELKKEEAEEDMGLPAVRESNSSGEFKIEDVPELSLDDLE